MNKIIIEDNIPEPDYSATIKGYKRVEGVWTATNSKYKVECIRAMATMEVGQSFLVYGRCEYTIKSWIHTIVYFGNKEGNIHGDKDFEIKTIKSEKPTTKIHNNQLGKIKCKQYPIRVWRIK